MRQDLYPRCGEIRTLESLPEGSTVLVSGWILTMNHSNQPVLMDGDGRTVRVKGVPRDLVERMQTGGRMLIGVDMYITVRYCEDDWAYTQWGRHDLEVEYYEPREGRCDCGAKYTSFPTHHSEWCGSLTWK